MDIFRNEARLPWADWIPDDPIRGFSDEYRFLSNFWLAEIHAFGMKFPSVENAYQAAKCLHPEDRKQFVNISPGKAKRLGRKVLQREDWEDEKLNVMRAFCLRKFVRHQELGQALLATNNRVILEVNTWGDVFWGVVEDKSGRLRGENHLGKILMSIRERLRNPPPETAFLEMKNTFY